MITRIRQIAVIEGVPWYVYPERPANVAKGETPRFPCQHWTEVAEGLPFYVADFGLNGFIVLTDTGLAPALPPGWQAEPAKTPEGFLYGDERWKVCLIHKTAEGAVFVAFRLRQP